MQQPQRHQLKYDGKLSQLYKLWIVNFFLNVITLGIFSFWGKTRVRRYVVSKFKLGDDRFEYTGTGGELFKSFLLALVFFGIISIPLIISAFNIEEFYDAHEAHYERLEILEAQLDDESLPVETEEQLSEEYAQISSELFMTFYDEHFITLAIFGLYTVFYFLYLPVVSKYGMLIYQMGHIRWRGIRGQQKGSALLFPFIRYFHLLLTIITLTLWLPFSDGYITRYKLNRLYFGTQKGLHKPQFGKLFKSHILTLLLAIFTLGLSRIWYRATLARMHTNDFNLGGMQFESTITGSDLCILHLVNFVILVFTIGLGYPIVLQRNMKFMAQHTLIIGDPDNLTVNQATGQKPTFGEGVSHWIDLGARFGTGYLKPYF